MWTLPGLLVGIAFMILCAFAVLIAAAILISVCGFFLGRHLSPRS